MLTDVALACLGFRYVDYKHAPAVSSSFAEIDERVIYGDSYCFSSILPYLEQS